MKCTIRAWGALALSFVIAGAHPVSGADKSSVLSAQDKDFVTKAMQAGYAEVAASKVAALRAEHPQLRKFGEQMVEDHGKAGDELMQIALSKGAKIPTAPNLAQKAFVKRLEKLKGKQFDRAYVREAGVKDHKAAVDLFTRQAKNGKDPQLKAFAEKMLPTLQQHFQTGQALSETISRKK